jgi:two-component system phosphate regulon sensor histidine kinase PhoR
MSKRFFIWIVVLMGISLPGIVMVMIYWLNNPMKMNNAIFDRQVIEALNDAAGQVQVNQDTRIINNDLSNDTSERYENSIIQPDSIVGRVNLSGINQAVSGLNNAQRRRLQMLQMMTHHYNSENKDWSTNRHIDLIKLKSIIKKELAENDISLKFHYAIFSGDSILESDFKTTVHPKWYKVNIFPDDIFNRDLYLGVYFPEMETFINRHQSLIPGLSIVLTLMVFFIYLLSVLSIIRQKKLSAMKTDFINNMTHEFKTPITTIGIAADSISKDDVIKDEDRIRFFSKMIIKENQRLNENVERILQAARFDRKELYFRFQDVQVHDLINEAIQGILIQVEKRGGRIVAKLDAVNPVIQTDPIHFTNMVHNLLDNANKYSPDPPDITVSTVSDQKGLYMSVEDKGIGISKKIQTKIFEKFYRLTYGNLENIKGFGLGLSYIKTILKLNNGSIKVYSEPGKGSRFVIFIPFSIKKL